MSMSDSYHRLPADEAMSLLSARLGDLCDRAAHGVAAVSPFLTPREGRFASHCLASRLSAGTAVLWGGFPDAERRRVILLPDYVEGMLDPVALACDPACALLGAGLDELSDSVRAAVTVLVIRGSGYRTLSHRDYLGSVLGLGLDRDAVGDIVVGDGETEDAAAYLATDARMAEFLLSELKKVATDTVKVSRLSEGTGVLPARRLAPIRDTIASERLDCVVAALCNLSRDRAQTAIRQGLVELDYEPVTDCDRTVVPPATLSVRGVGKFVVEAFDGETRKGRLRLAAGKYI